MSKRTRTALVVCVAALALIVLAAPAFAAPQTYTAHLSGTNEVPAVDTTAAGQVIFKLSKDGTELSYKLIVSRLENVRAAHIHTGVAGVNGGVIVTLLSTPLPGWSHGVIATGTITAADGGGTLSDLIARIEAGTTYVNVHTLANPGGAIRGQIR